MKYAKELKPSARGELEITDLNRVYLEKGDLNVELLGQGFTWLDTGTHESLVDATNFVKTVETHQHRKIACLEEIAYLNGWISKDEVMEVYEVLKKNQYGQYLKDVLTENTEKTCTRILKQQINLKAGFSQRKSCIQ